MGEERIRIESYNMNEGKQPKHTHTCKLISLIIITNPNNDRM
jgi:hypothetical protein